MGFPSIEGNLSFKIAGEFYEFGQFFTDRATSDDLRLSRELRSIKDEKQRIDEK